MTSVKPPPDESSPKHPADFSLFLGGPLFQLLQRAHLAGETPSLVRRRIVALVVLTWVPLLVLSIVAGHAWGTSVRLTFLRDVQLHVRLLVALPLLLAAEVVADERMRPLLRQFIDRGLVPEAERGKLDAAAASATRLRDSSVAELLLLAFVYVVGMGLLWRTHAGLYVTSWFGVSVEGRLQPSLAGWWNGLVSLPVFQFLLLRWYYRLAILARFLWQVSRLDLRIVPTHPDRCGGLGFLAMESSAFAPLLVAQGAMVAGAIADRILFAGARLTDFKLEIALMFSFMLFAILGPTLVFSTRMAAAKRACLLDYGGLSQRYVDAFDRKWLHGGAPPGEPLLGSADIQSLADLGNSFEIARKMRLVPFTIETVVQLALAAVLPVAPLLLTMISLEDLLVRLLGMVF